MRVNFEEDLILVPGRQAAEMIRRRANATGIIVATKDNVRTVDSFLMNYGKGARCQFKRLFIDEGLCSVNIQNIRAKELNIGWQSYTKK